MIDFHSHLLPGIDDGSKNVTETIMMLEQEYQQGVSKIVATPHFYAGRNSVEHFLKRRAESMEKVCAAVKKKEEMPKLYCGAEVYYFPGMGKAEQITRLCIEGTELLLLELPFCQWTEEILKDVRQMTEKRNIHVILAHVERYYTFQKEKSVWDELLQHPVYIQLNGGCFLDWKKRRFGIHMLQERENVVLGSDCHNLTKRPPNLMQARELIRRKTGEGKLLQIDQLGERILR